MVRTVLIVVLLLGVIAQKIKPQKGEAIQAETSKGKEHPEDRERKRPGNPFDPSLMKDQPKTYDRSVYGDSLDKTKEGKLTREKMTARQSKSKLSGPRRSSRTKKEKTPLEKMEAESSTELFSNVGVLMAVAAGFLCLVVVLLICKKCNKENQSKREKYQRKIRANKEQSGFQYKEHPVRQELKRWSPIDSSSRSFESSIK